MSAGQTVALITSLAPKIVTPIIEDKVDDWLDENITNPDSPPLDRSLSSSSSAAPADMVGDLKSAIEEIQTTYNFHNTGNLYNTDELVTRYYINPANGQITAVANDYFAYSRTYVPVVPDEYITATDRMFIAWYDDKYDLISGMQLDTTKKTQVPSGASFARFSCSSTNHANVLVRRGQLADTGDNMKYTMRFDGFDRRVLDDLERENFTEGENLYNPYKLVRNYYINPANGGITPVANAAFAYSKTFVPVTPGEYLCATDRMMIAYYDKDFTVCAYEQMDTTKVTTVPSGAYYARFSCSSADHFSVTVKRGSTLGSKVPYHFRLEGIDVSETPIVVAPSGGDYTSFTQAVYSNVDNKKPIIVKPGTYNIVSEYVSLFGETTVNSLADATSGMNNFQYGIRLHDRKVTFEPGAHLVLDWTGHTSDGTHRFCAFRVEQNTEIIGLDLDCTNTWYCIHDDYGTSDNSPYTIKYTNCRVIGHSLTNANCIGGGCHKFSRHELTNCYFKNNVTNDDIVLSADVRYHNTNVTGAEPEIYVSNCYFSNNFNVAYYGSQTTKLRAYVNNCYAPHGINKLAESESSTTDNVELYAWNNQTT